VSVRRSQNYSNLTPKRRWCDATQLNVGVVDLDLLVDTEASPPPPIVGRGKSYTHSKSGRAIKRIVAPLPEDEIPAK